MPSSWNGLRWSELLGITISNRADEDVEAAHTREEAQEASQRTSEATRQQMEDYREVMNEVNRTFNINPASMENPPNTPAEDGPVWVGSQTPHSGFTINNEQGMPDCPDDTTTWNWNLETEEWEATEIDNSCNGKCGLILCEECMEDPRKAISF